MSLILVISIMIRVVAMGLSVVLLRRMRNWWMGFLTVMLGLMTLRQTLTLLTEKESWAISVTGHTTELPGLIVSIMAFLAVFFLKRIITEQKRAEKELQERKNENTKLAVVAKERGELQEWINTFDTFVGKFDPGGVGIIFNETPVKAGGLTKDDVVGKYFPDTMWWSHSEIEKARIVECFEKAKAGLSSRIETNFRSADGTPVPIIFNCQPVMDDDKVKYITAEGKIIIEELKLRNALQKEKESLEKRVKERTSELVVVNEELREEITERKLAEAHIQHLQSVLMAIRDVNQLIVREKNQRKLLQRVCEILNQTRNCKLVWIGLIEEGTKNILPAAQAGFEESYLKSIRVTWDDSETGKGPTGTAIKTWKPFVMRDISSDPRYKPWKEEAMKRGYASSIAVPLVHENRVFGALNVYTAIPDAFDDEEIGLLIEVGQDIAFALHNIEVEEKLRKHSDRLEELVKERTHELEGKTAELEQANIRLQELDRLKSLFIASMSHELRTPLNSIIGFTGIILKGIVGGITEEQRKQLTMVKNSANHLLDLINDIIDLSKIEAGTVELSIEEFDLLDLLQEAKESFVVAAEEKGLKISLDMPEKLTIESDKRRTWQVITNLVSNAIKFTDGGEIEIKAERKVDGVEVSVRDTGIGIKKEDKDKLFIAFSRIRSKGRLREGSGLGLYLSEKIAKLLSSEIKAESEFGKGSVFTFTLPLKYIGMKR